MQILMFGGTRFFGLRLARRLVADGHRLTILTRGQTPDDLGNDVERLHADAGDAAALARALQGRAFDLVYDQICYTPRDAKAHLDALGERVERYVFTSTMAVYRDGGEPREAVCDEEAFAPGAYPYDLDASEYGYAEGKRQAEAYFFRHARFPVAAARVPMVISGTDDYTGRFDFHVAHIAREEAIGVDEEEHEITFITAWDVADFLRFLGTSPYAGPINCGNDGYLSAQGISRAIGDALGKTPRFTVTPQGDPNHSPYALFGSLRASSARAQELGYAFPPLLPQVPEMARQAAKRLSLG